MSKEEDRKGAGVGIRLENTHGRQEEYFYRGGKGAV